MAGHNGGPSAGTWFLSSAVLADHVERQMDELGWDTAHIVGNSLGGWVAFELERRGRARSVTGIAPAGGWTRWSPAKFEVIAKFVLGIPLAGARLVVRAAGAAPAVQPPVSHLCDQRIAGRGQRARTERHHRRRRALPRLLPAAGQGAAAARPARARAQRRPGASGDLRKGSDHPRTQVHPAFHRPPAGRPQGHRARRRRTRADVRGAGTGHRGDHRLPRPVHRRPDRAGPSTRPAS